MEFVGKEVRRKFGGFGVFSGIIESYDPVSGFFRVVYEDGDSEELELSEIPSVLVKEGRRPRGRPRKRRWIARKAAGCVVSVRIEGIGMQRITSQGNMDDTHVAEGSFPAKVSTETGCSGVVPVEDKEEIAFGGAGVTEGRSVETLAGIDGVCKANCSLSRISEEGAAESEELALPEAGEDTETGDGCPTSGANCDYAVDFKKNEALLPSIETDNTTCPDLPSLADSVGRLDSSEIKLVDAGLGAQNSSIIQGEVHMQCGESVFDLNSKYSEGNVFSTAVAQSKRHDDCANKQGANNVIVGVMGVVETSLEEERGNQRPVNLHTPVTRKSLKRKHVENGTLSPPVTLRRSARRAATSFGSVTTVPVSSEPSAPTSADAIPSGHRGKLVDRNPPKDQHCFVLVPSLPPSSKNLDIDELPALDLFSTYSCLRSFSTFLFLSPFTLEAYIAALKSGFVNPLVDSIHFALLHSLKRHMKSLSCDDSSMASACLKNLDWEFLDLVTWPVYLVEYLLFSGSPRNSGLQLAQLKFSRGEYYKQPVAVKLAVLRCLCDDFMDVEEIRAEIARRILSSELYGDVDRGLNGVCATDTVGTSSKGFKRRKVSSTDLAEHVLALEKDGGGGSPMHQIVTVDSLDSVKNDDWNSDDCCLCKMDGVLICCDGCPAAYHSRCVGIARDLLPEGDWYCPECAMDNAVGRWKSYTPLQGGSLLGIDPLGRTYLATCGYLLVLTSYDGGTCHYYNKSDLKLVIEMLKSCDFICDDIASAIMSHWEVPVDSIKEITTPTVISSSVFTVNSQNDSSQIPSVPPGFSEENLVAHNGTSRKKDEECCFELQKNRLQATTASELIDKAKLVTVKVESPEAEIPVGSLVIKDAQSPGESDMPDTFGMVVEDVQPKTSVLASVAENCSNTAAPSNRLSYSNDDAPLTFHSDPSLYVNRYSLGQISAYVAEEICLAFPNGIQADVKKSTAEIVRPLFKIFSGSSRTFSWPSVERKVVGMVNENCGWCYTCKNVIDVVCLFKLIDKNVEVPCEKKAVGIRSRKNRKSHLTSLVLQILSVEERLNGLLSGPWQNPHYRKHWRKCLLKASSISTVKHHLLILEENIREIALRGDWLKHVDSSSLGSSFHFSTQLDDVADGIGRKRTRKASGPDSAAIRSGIHWWRGGAISRRLFHWKMLPRSLALKCGRQAGCKKIPGILYPDTSDFVKRSKRIAWRASVEFSPSVADLGRQVRDLDAHIKWGNIMAVEFPLESSKRFRAWKKVTIRRKCQEGDTVKYLLDFGKRKVVPDIVTKNGTKLEDASNEKEKYWLNESFVPLNLLRAYEERRLGRGSKKMSVQPIQQEMVKQHTSSRRDWLSRLMSKSEQCGTSVCGFCSKDLVARDAVNCQFCKGCFHRRHVSVSKSTRSKGCTVTCYNCRDKMKVTTKVSKRKTTKVNKSRKSELPTLEYPNLRRSARSASKAKSKFWQTKKLKNVTGPKGSKKSGGKKVPTKGVKGIPKINRSRSTKSNYVFWLNGLLWTKKTNDVRVKEFIQTNVLMPQAADSSTVAPVCFICRKIYDSCLIYMSCGICKEWFHGDSLGITVDNVNNLLGFKCHKCCKRKRPVCPYSKEMTLEASSLQSSCTELKIGDVLSDDDMLLSDFQKKPRLLPAEEIQKICCDNTVQPAQVPVGDVDPCETRNPDVNLQVENSLT